MSFESITHVIFDMDGLLINTEELYTLVTQSVLDEFNVKFTYDVKARMMGLGLWFFVVNFARGKITQISNKRTQTGWRCAYFTWGNWYKRQNNARRVSQSNEATLSEILSPSKTYARLVFTEGVL